ncbi:uncharacterized protein LOC134829251 isoform X1 [Culicoides brevitarsis]|uniref:uncharacterized protein LOC134829251 isoform X1 n=1 Tax=Culicoides brevitarsis TaxID=469753 RepID=UPI00307BF9F7
MMDSSLLDRIFGRLNQRFENERLQSINETIQSGDAKAVEKLLESPEDEFMTKVTELAIKSENLVIIDTVFGFYEQQILRERFNRIQFFEHTLSLEVNPDKKWEIIQIILRYTLAVHPDSASMYPITYIFYVILCCCLNQKELLTKFFDIYYQEERNSLFPFMKSLEETVDGSHFITILLHEDLDLSKIADGLPLRTVVKMISYITRHIKRIFETFMKLIQKNTKESMELAVMAFKELLFKDFYKYYVLNSMYDLGKLPRIMEDPLTKKLCFQFIYYLMEVEWQDDVYKLIKFWLRECYPETKFYRHVFEIIRPFVQKPSPVENLLENNDSEEEKSEDDQDEEDEFNPFDDEESISSKKIKLENDECQIRSLQELCRDTIRSKIAKNVADMKTFFDNIWSLNIPSSVKCSLLYIPDASWMNDLFEF